MQRVYRYIFFISSLVYMQASTAGAELQEIYCSSPRPQACTQQYDPVCARVDTGIRCITTPCESFRYQTFSNACHACMNAKVIATTAGSCENPGTAK